MHIFLLLLRAISQDEFIFFFIPFARWMLLFPLGWQLLLLKSAKTWAIPLPAPSAPSLPTTRDLWAKIQAWLAQSCSQFRTKKIRNNWSELPRLLKPATIKGWEPFPKSAVPFFSPLKFHLIKRGDLAPHKAVKEWLDKAQKCDSGWKNRKPGAGRTEQGKLDKIWSKIGFVSFFFVEIFNPQHAVTLLLQKSKPRYFV